jgi:hypothetical protein
MPTVRPRTPARRQAVGEPVRHLPDDPRELLDVRDVGVEGRLGRPRLRRPDSACTGASSWKCARARRKRPWRAPKRSASRASSAACSAPIVARPTAASARRSSGRSRGASAAAGRRAADSVLAPEGDEAAGLLEVARDLRHEAVRADAHRDHDAGRRLDGGDELAQDAQRLGRRR